MGDRAAKLLIKGGKAELYGSKHLHNTALNKAANWLGYGVVAGFVIASVGGSFTAGVGINQHKESQSIAAQMSQQNTEALIKSGTLLTRSDSEFNSEPTDEDRPSFR